MTFFLSRSFSFVFHGKQIDPPPGLFHELWDCILARKLSKQNSMAKKFIQKNNYKWVGVVHDEQGIIASSYPVRQYHDKTYCPHRDTPNGNHGLHTHFFHFALTPGNPRNLSPTLFLFSVSYSVNCTPLKNTPSYSVRLLRLFGY